MIAVGGLDLEWGAELGGERAGLLLAPSRDPDNIAFHHLMDSLSELQSPPVPLRLSAAMPALELRRWARRISSGGASAGELGSGS